MALRPGTQQRADQYAAQTRADAAYAADNHEQLVTWFEDAEEASRDSRRLAERDRDYYDNKQLTAAELKELNLRGQPAIIINRIQTKVNFLLGYEASQRTDPRGFPRTPQDEDASAACTDALRYLRDKTNAAQVFSDVWENMLVEGFGGCEVGLEYTARGDIEITLTHVPWDRLFYDPHSRRHDFNDSRYHGIVIWMDEDDALEKWPDGRSAISRTIDEDVTRTYSDRPAWKQWAQAGRRKRVRIVQMYYRHGAAWHCCIFTRGGKLQSWEVSFQDEDGRSLCPLIMQSAFVDRENNRYGFVRALISPQDEINKRRSKLLHLAMGKPFVYEAGAIDNVDETKRQIAQANGAIEVNPGSRFEFLDNSVEIAGHTNLLQHATQEIDLQGPNAVMQGKGERGASGRAKMVDQQGGQTEIYRLVDRHSHLKKRVYVTQWSVVRQEWTAEKWIRVTDDEKNVRFVGLNRPVRMVEDLLDQATRNGVEEEDAKAQLAEQAQDPMIRAQLEQVVRIENIPAEMNMDIIVEEVPDSANLQQEQFEIMASLAGSGVPIPPKALIQASALRDKTKIIEEIDKAEQDPAAQAVAQTQIEKLAVEVEKLKAEVADTKASAVKKLAEADAVDKQFGAVADPDIVQGGTQNSLSPNEVMPQGGAYPPPAPQQFNPPQQAGF